MNYRMKSPELEEKLIELENRHYIQRSNVGRKQVILVNPSIFSPTSPARGSSHSWQGLKGDEGHLPTFTDFTDSDVTGETSESHYLGYTDNENRHDRGYKQTGENGEKNRAVKDEDTGKTTEELSEKYNVDPDSLPFD